MINLLLCYILFLPFIYGNSVPALISPEPKEIKHNLTPAANNKLSQNVIAEGGAIIPSNPITQLKDHPTLLLSTEDELNESKNKSSVVGRKGVPNDKIIVNQKFSSPGENSIDKITTKIPSKPFNDTIKQLVNDTEKLNITKIHKPLILSHEALVKMDELNNLHISEDNAPEIKVNSMKAGSRPAMIMPIVITILVVPMFAVIGYLALTRGREAWKNRHYKRMDFLLDGMYND